MSEINACVFCGIAERTETEAVVFSNSLLSVVVTLDQKDRNWGAVMIIPYGHHANLYDLPIETLGEVGRVSQLCARALKAALGCDGITILQNNEPAGGQDVFHYHMHVIPRFSGDHYFERPGRNRSFVERKAVGERIKTEFGTLL